MTWVPYILDFWTLSNAYFYISLCCLLSTWNELHFTNARPTEAVGPVQFGGTTATRSLWDLGTRAHFRQASAAGLNTGPCGPSVKDTNEGWFTSPYGSPSRLLTVHTELAATTECFVLSKITHPTCENLRSSSPIKVGCWLTSLRIFFPFKCGTHDKRFYKMFYKRFYTSSESCSSCWDLSSLNGQWIIHYPAYYMATFQNDERKLHTNIF